MERMTLEVLSKLVAEDTECFNGSENTAENREKVKKLVDSILSVLKMRRHIHTFAVQCNESNNPPSEERIIYNVMVELKRGVPNYFRVRC